MLAATLLHAVRFSNQFSFLWPGDFYDRLSAFPDHFALIAPEARSNYAAVVSRGNNIYK